MKVPPQAFKMETVPAAAAAYFKYKAVTAVVILVCWPSIDQRQLMTQMWSQNIMVITRCPDHRDSLNFTVYAGVALGVIYFTDGNDIRLSKIHRNYFGLNYKWLIIGDHIPEVINNIRYDSDIAFVPLTTPSMYNFDIEKNVIEAIESTELQYKTSQNQIYLYDIYVHPKEGASAHAWATWNVTDALIVNYEMERIRRRFNFKGYSLRIAASIGMYNPKIYNDSYQNYLVDERNFEQDSATRCGYGFYRPLFVRLNITETLQATTLWNSIDPGSDSMARMLIDETAHVGASILRIMIDRLPIFDFISAVWPFRSGFIYVAERESSANMFADPFSEGAWWACAAFAVILALALLLTARSQMEREGAIYAAIATYLQQDASAVPAGASGRGVFMVLSVCSMLLHSYYTSAVVSSLLDGDRGGPRTIRELADSKFKAASQDYDYIRYFYFEVTTNWDDLEYFKKKKKTSSFYQGQDIQRGVELVGSGTTAYNTEYNSIYPHLARSLPDSDLCRLRHVDIIPEVKTYVLGIKNGEFTNTLKSNSQWLHEIGIANRVLSKWRAEPPACRASVIAEKVKMADVMPLVIVMMVGSLASMLVLWGEMLVFKRQISFKCLQRVERMDEIENF